MHQSGSGLSEPGSFHLVKWFHSLLLLLDSFLFFPVKVDGGNEAVPSDAPAPGVGSDVFAVAGQATDCVDGTELLLWLT